MQNLKRILFIFAIFLCIFTIILSDNADAAGSFKSGITFRNKKIKPLPKTSKTNKVALTPPLSKRTYKKISTAAGKAIKSDNVVGNESLLPTLNIHADDMPLWQCLEKLSRLTRYYIRTRNVRLAKKVSINETGNLAAILDALFPDYKVYVYPEKKEIKVVNNEYNK